MDPQVGQLPTGGVQEVSFAKTVRPKSCKLHRVARLIPDAYINALDGFTHQIEGTQDLAGKERQLNAVLNIKILAADPNRRTLLRRNWYEVQLMGHLADACQQMNSDFHVGIERDEIDVGLVPTLAVCEDALGQLRALIAKREHSKANRLTVGRRDLATEPHITPRHQNVEIEGLRGTVKFQLHKTGQRLVSSSSWATWLMLASR